MEVIPLYVAENALRDMAKFMSCSRKKQAFILNLKNRNAGQLRDRINQRLLQLINRANTQVRIDRNWEARWKDKKCKPTKRGR